LLGNSSLNLAAKRKFLASGDKTDPKALGTSLCLLRASGEHWSRIEDRTEKRVLVTIDVSGALACSSRCLE